MSVSVKRAALRKFLNDVLFEDLKYGIYDRPGPTNDTEPETVSTVPNEVPVEPTEMMATQLADERPPIEDDDYLPENPKELGLAASQIARMIPDGQIEKFYRDMLLLYDNAVGEENTSKSEDEGEEEEVTEAVIRKAIQNILEAMGRTPPGGVDWDQPRYGSSSDDEYGDEGMSVQQWDAGDDPEPEVDMSSDEMSLEDLATAGGYSSASGARQDIERLVARMKYLGTELPAGDLEALRDFGAAEFIDEMKANDYLDDEDIVELQQNLGMVKDLDSFRFFFVAAILMPAYQEVKRIARKGVEAEIGKLGVPKKTHQTILNQALGETPRNPKKLAAKLARDYAAENPGDKDAAKKAAELATKVNATMSNLAKLAGPGDNILDLAKTRWSKQSKGRRAKALEQALGQTNEFQEEMADAK